MGVGRREERRPWETRCYPGPALEQALGGNTGMVEEGEEDPSLV